MQKSSKRLIIFIGMVAVITALGFGFQNWKKNLIKVGQQNAPKQPTAEMIQQGLMPQFKNTPEEKSQKNVKAESSLILKNLNI